jgi:predicted AlkP superfamily phosphohydrolase/phosphomutase
MSHAGAGPRRRVLLIGLDSADADLIDGWINAGFLPTFARLRQDGIHARLGTTAEVMHVSAWPTIYTGTTPGHHGLYHAYQIRAGEQLIHRTEPASAGQPPFWKFLDEAGRRCIVFDAFMDYRLPGYRGMQILDYGTWTWFGEPGSSPPGLLRDIRRRFGAYPAPEHSNFVQVPDDVAGFAAQLVAGAQQKSRIAQALMREHDWDFLFVTFGEPHGAGHYLWHVGDAAYPTHPAGSSHPVREVYAAIDAAIGELLAAADDRTTVIVTSGDGMGPNYSGCHLMPELLHRMGHYFAAGVGGGASRASVPKKGLLATLRQAVPLELRQSVTRCLPRSLRYRMSMKWVNSGIDWTRTRLFCIPNSNEGYFRVNLRGREPLGIVQPGAECDELVASLAEALHGLRQPASRAPAAERVTRVDEVFRGPRRGDLPDAVISWNLEARVTDALEAPGVGLVRGQAGHAVSPFYTGNHRAAAFVFARGPGISGGGPAGGHILDIAPTVLAMLGVEVPRHFEGRAWPWRS